MRYTNPYYFMTVNDLEGHFRYYERFHCLYLKYTAYVMYDVNYNGRTS